MVMVVLSAMVVIRVLLRLPFPAFVGVSPVLSQLLDSSQLFLMPLDLFVLPGLLLFPQFFLLLFSQLLFLSLPVLDRRVHAIAIMMLTHIEDIIVFMQCFCGWFFLDDFLVKSFTIFFN
jgi:hypothetical protein